MFAKDAVESAATYVRQLLMEPNVPRSWLMLVEALNARLPPGAIKFRANLVRNDSSWPRLADDAFLGNSDYGAPTDYPELEAQYESEIAAIMAWLRDTGPLEPPKPNWEFGYKAWRDAYLSFRRHRMEERSLAIDLWGALATPYRLWAGKIFRVHAPRTIQGSIVCQRWEINEFLDQVSTKMAESDFRVVQLERQRRLLFGLLAALTVFACGLVVTILLKKS